MQCKVAVILFVICMIQANLSEELSSHEAAEGSRGVHLTFPGEVSSSQALVEKSKQAGIPDKCKTPYLINCVCVAPEFEKVVRKMKDVLKIIRNAMQKSSGPATDNELIREINKCTTKLEDDYKKVDELFNKKECTKGFDLYNECTEEGILCDKKLIQLEPKAVEAILEAATPTSAELKILTKNFNKKLEECKIGASFSSYFQANVGHQLAPLPFNSSRVVDTVQQILLPERSGGSNIKENGLQCNCVAPKFKEIVKEFPNCLEVIVRAIRKNKECETDEKNISNIKGCVANINENFKRMGKAVAKNDCTTAMRLLGEVTTGSGGCSDYFNKLSDSTKVIIIIEATPCSEKVNSLVKQLQQKWSECSGSSSTKMEKDKEAADGDEAMSDSSSDESDII